MSMCSESAVSCPSQKGHRYIEADRFCAGRNVHHRACSWLTLPGSHTREVDASGRLPEAVTWCQGMGVTAGVDWQEWRREAVACLGDQLRDLPRDPSSGPALMADELVRELDDAGVRWILNGSMVLVAAGVEFLPGDLDVVPQLEPANLERLASVLDRLDAFPEVSPGWEYSLTPDEARRWRPHPSVEANLNHRFVTAYGILDVVPRLTGTYDDLLEGSWTVMLGGRDVTVAEPAPIVERLRLSQRRKDRDRWEAASHLHLDRD